MVSWNRSQEGVSASGVGYSRVGRSSPTSFGTLNGSEGGCRREGAGDEGHANIASDDRTTHRTDAVVISSMVSTRKS